MSFNAFFLTCSMEVCCQSFSWSKCMNICIIYVYSWYDKSLKKVLKYLHLRRENLHILNSTYSLLACYLETEPKKYLSSSGLKLDDKEMLVKKVFFFMNILAHIYIFRAMHRMLELHLLISEGMLKVFSVTSLHLCRYDWDKQSLEQKKHSYRIMDTFKKQA